MKSYQKFHTTITVYLENRAVVSQDHMQWYWKVWSPLWDDRHRMAHRTNDVTL